MQLQTLFEVLIALVGPEMAISRKWREDWAREQVLSFPPISLLFIICVCTVYECKIGLSSLFTTYLFS